MKAEAGAAYDEGRGVADPLWTLHVGESKPEVGDAVCEFLIVVCLPCPAPAQKPRSWSSRYPAHPDLFRGAGPVDTRHTRTYSAVSLHSPGKCGLAAPYSRPQQESQCGSVLPRRDCAATPPPAPLGACLLSRGRLTAPP